MFIAMIWRPTPDRMPAFNEAMQFWSQLGDVRFFDSGHEMFNRAASRNLAVRTAQAEGYDRLVVTDADCVPELTPVRAALEQADDIAVHLPYNLCRVFDTAGYPVAEFDFTCGGVYVTTPTAWFAAHGQDERFTTWAPEDMAFKFAHETLLGPMRRDEGLLKSLGHERDPNRHADSESDPNVMLYRAYQKAAGDREAMARLCSRS